MSKRDLNELHIELQSLVQQCISMAADRKLMEELAARMAQFEERLAVVERRVNQ